MSLTTQELFGIYPAIFDSLTISHVSSVEPQHNVQKMVVVPGGSVDPAVVAEINRKPMVNLTAHDLAAILTAVSPTLGLSVSSAWKIQYQQKADGGTFTGSGANVLLSGSKGKLLVDSISAQQDQQDPVDCLLKFYALWDGSTVDGNSDPLPISVSTAQNLTGSPSVGAIYKLGCVVYEGSKLGGVQSAKVTFGVGYNTTSADGEKAARIGTVDLRSPTFEADVHNLSLLSTNGHGLKQASSGMSIYFRRIGYTDASSSHLKLTLGGGAYETTPNGVSKEGKAVTKLMMTGTGTITVDTAAAMP